MRLGERALITARKEYAFKSGDSELKIPSGYEDKRDLLSRKWVAYDVELLDFDECIDLNGDGLYIKHIITRGKGKKKPQNADEVLSI